jgi:hypothetical protein
LQDDNTFLLRQTGIFGKKGIILKMRILGNEKGAVGIYSGGVRSGLPGVRSSGCSGIPDYFQQRR